MRLGEPSVITRGAPHLRKLCAPQAEETRRAGLERNEGWEQCDGKQDTCTRANGTIITDKAKVVIPFLEGQEECGDKFCRCSQRHAPTQAAIGLIFVVEKGQKGRRASGNTSSNFHPRAEETVRTQRGGGDGRGTLRRQGQS